MQTVERTPKTYDQRYGSPYDRGSLDAYYWRSRDPHYYVGDSFSTARVSAHDMTVAELEAYNAGYDEQRDRKSWD